MAIVCAACRKPRDRSVNFSKSIGLSFSKRPFLGTPALAARSSWASEKIWEGGITGASDGGAALFASPSRQADATFDEVRRRARARHGFRRPCSLAGDAFVGSGPPQEHPCARSGSESDVGHRELLQYGIATGAGQDAVAATTWPAVENDDIAETQGFHARKRRPGCIVGFIDCARVDHHRPVDKPVELVVAHSLGDERNVETVRQCGRDRDGKRQSRRMNSCFHHIWSRLERPDPAPVEIAPPRWLWQAPSATAP